MKKNLNTIRFLIVVNIGIFLISTWVIFKKITGTNNTEISSQKNITEQETTFSQKIKDTEQKPLIKNEEENNNLQTNQNNPVIEKTFNQEMNQPKQEKSLTAHTKSLTKQKKSISSTLPETEISTNTGYAEKVLPQTRNIKFTFFSRQAKKISIIGDFNNWIPQPMSKVTENRWEITLKIPAGQDYLYNFLVDGKVTIDPNNKKPPQISPQGFKSSVLSL